MVGTSNSLPEALITFRVSLAGSGPGGGWTGTAGISEGSMSTPTGLTLVVDLAITGCVWEDPEGVVAAAAVAGETAASELAALAGS